MFAIEYIEIRIFLWIFGFCCNYILKSNLQSKSKIPENRWTLRNYNEKIKMKLQLNKIIPEKNLKYQQVKTQFSSANHLNPTYSLVFNILLCVLTLKKLKNISVYLYYVYVMHSFTTNCHSVSRIVEHNTVYLRSFFASKIFNNR